MPPPHNTAECKIKLCNFSLGSVLIHPEAQWEEELVWEVSFFKKFFDHTWFNIY